LIVLIKQRSGFHSDIMSFYSQIAIW